MHPVTCFLLMCLGLLLQYEIAVSAPVGIKDTQSTTLSSDFSFFIDLMTRSLLTPSSHPHSGLVDELTGLSLPLLDPIEIDIPPPPTRPPLLESLEIDSVPPGPSHAVISAEYIKLTNSGDNEESNLDKVFELLKIKFSENLEEGAYRPIGSQALPIPTAQTTSMEDNNDATQNLLDSNDIIKSPPQKITIIEEKDMLEGPPRIGDFIDLTLVTAETQTPKTQEQVDLPAMETTTTNIEASGDKNLKNEQRPTKSQSNPVPVIQLTGGTDEETLQTAHTPAGMQAVPAWFVTVEEPRRSRRAAVTSEDLVDHDQTEYQDHERQNLAFLRPINLPDVKREEAFRK